jgi:SAM-dependent methyltransferase
MIWSPERCKGHWRNAKNANAPEKYLWHYERTVALVDFLPGGLNKKGAVLEVGCNSGRNLRGLQVLGFEFLRGVDINETAIQIAEEESFGIEYWVGDAATKSFWMGSPVHELIFTMAVLQHIPEDAVLDYIAHHALHILTIENEYNTSKHDPSHFRRNYYTEFTSRGFIETRYKQDNDPHTFGAPMVFRFFKKATLWKSE